MTDAITYGNLLLKLGETPLSVYHLSIGEEAGKRGLMSVNAETNGGLCRQYNAENLPAYGTYGYHSGNGLGFAALYHLT